MAETILQAPLLTDFVYPFLIVFLISFAVIQKTKLMGDADNKEQINAFLSFVIGLIFVSAVYPKQVVENLVLFLAVSLVVLFVFLLLWYFILGEDGPQATKGAKGALAVIFGLAFIVAVLWATGVSGDVYGFFVNQIWGSEFLRNLIFVVLIGAALAFIVKSAGGGGGDK